MGNHCTTCANENVDDTARSSPKTGQSPQTTPTKGTKKKNSGLDAHNRIHPETLDNDADDATPPSSPGQKRSRDRYRHQQQQLQSPERRSGGGRGRRAPNKDGAGAMDASSGEDEEEELQRTSPPLLLLGGGGSTSATATDDANHSRANLHKSSARVQVSASCNVSTNNSNTNTNSTGLQYLSAKDRGLMSSIISRNLRATTAPMMAAAPGGGLSGRGDLGQSPEVAPPRSPSSTRGGDRETSEKSPATTFRTRRAEPSAEQLAGYHAALQRQLSASVSPPPPNDSGHFPQEASLDRDAPPAVPVRPTPPAAVRGPKLFSFSAQSSPASPVLRVAASAPPVIHLCSEGAAIAPVIGNSSHQRRPMNPPVVVEEPPPGHRRGAAASFSAGPAPSIDDGSDDDNDFATPAVMAVLARGLVSESDDEGGPSFTGTPRSARHPSEQPLILSRFPACPEATAPFMAAPNRYPSAPPSSSPRTSKRGPGGCSTGDAPASDNEDKEEPLHFVLRQATVTDVAVPRPQQQHPAAAIQEEVSGIAGAATRRTLSHLDPASPMPAPQQCTLPPGCISRPSTRDDDINGGNGNGIPEQQPLAHFRRPMHETVTTSAATAHTATTSGGTSTRSSSSLSAPSISLQAGQGPQQHQQQQKASYPLSRSASSVAAAEGPKKQSGLTATPLTANPSSAGGQVADGCSPVLSSSVNTNSDRPIIQFRPFEAYHE